MPLLLYALFGDDPKVTQIVFQRGTVWLLVLLPCMALAQSDGLFEDLSFPAVSRSADVVLELSGVDGVEPREDDTPIPKRSVRIDVLQLAAAGTQLAARSSPRVILNLFEDVVYTAVVERVSPTRTGYVLSGRLEGFPFGTMTLVVNGDLVAGTIRTGTTEYSIRNIGRGAHLVEETVTPMMDGNDFLIPTRGEIDATDAQQTARDSEDDGSEIDLFVFWTSDAREAVGGVARMQAQIDLVVAETNNAYLASGAEQRINLVGAGETNFDPLGDSSVDLRRFRVDPAIRAVRDSYAADLVHLIVARGDVNGIAYVSLPGGNAESFAYGLTRVSRQTVPGLVFAHELGHNMGLLHDRYEDPSNDPYPYSHGYVNQRAFEEGSSPDACWYTVMAYPTQCVFGGYTKPVQLARFSNPQQQFPEADGDPMGIPGDEPSSDVDGPADAVRSLNDTRRQIANFRASENRCSYRLSERQQTVAAVGGAFTVGVETEPGCTFDAHGHGDFLSPTSVSDGEMRYRVLPNPGVARFGWISIGGEMLTVRQSSADPPAAVCDRSPTIRDALVTRSGRSACADVSEFDLLEIDNLTLHHRGISQLLPGDLSGLVRLRTLNLRGNELTTVPDLADVPRLEHLVLPFNELAGTIPPELGALMHLTHLHLCCNELSGAIPNELMDLKNLQQLNLGSNALTGPIPSFLASMPSLVLLSLGNNRFTGTIPAALGDLSRLLILALNDNELTGGIPPELGNLRNLASLRLRGNFLSGTIPPTLAHTRLNSLDLGQNELTGEIPSEIGTLAPLQSIDLAQNRLTGSIPATLGDLSNLHTLDLVRNELTGTIPPELRSLSKLEHLTLYGNRLTGCIPPGLAAVRYNDLDQIGLRTCGSVLAIEPNAESPAGEDATSTDAVPEGSDVVFRLVADPAPSTALDVTVTISGGRGFGVVNGPHRVRIASGNTTQLLSLATEDDAVEEEDATVTAAIAHSGSYAVLSQRRSASIVVADNEGPSAPTIHTVMPGDKTLTVVWNAPEEQVLPIDDYELRHRPSITIPGPDGWSRRSVGTDERYTLRNLTNETSYDVQVRALDEDGWGPWSKPATGAPRFCIDIAEADCRILLAAMGALVGTGTPLNWHSDRPVGEWHGVEEVDGNGRVVDLWLRGDDLKGVIPPTLGGLSELKYLYVIETGLSGEIPTELGNLTRLWHLVLRGNELTGPIPSSLGNLPNLSRLSLAENELSGTIPSELGNLQNLTRLWLRNNKLSGTIPAELGTLPRLELLNLRDNDLSGAIPPEIGLLSLAWAIWLQGNALSGTIPPTLADLSNLQMLRLNDNNLSGDVPAELVKLRLREVYLADNPLECVPAELRQVPEHDLDALGVADCVPGVIDVRVESKPRDNEAYRAGEEIWISIGFDRPVKLAGRPRLALTIGLDRRDANFGYHWRDKIAFRYEVQPTDNDDDGFGIEDGALSADGGVLVGLDGVNAKLSLGRHAFGNDPEQRIEGAVMLPQGKEIELVGYGDRVSLDRVFAMASGDLTYSVTGDEALFDASVRDGWLELIPNEQGDEGRSRVTVVAQDAAGKTWIWEFEVVVVAHIRGLPLWLRALGGEAMRR